MQDFSEVISTQSKGSIDGFVLSMVSKTYEFELIDPPLPQFAKLGKLRVVAVVINESDLPELGLFDVNDINELVEFHPLCNLRVDLSGHRPD